MHKMMVRVATIKEIAEHLGLSSSTVSIALRSGKGIKEETVKRIREAAEELGYTKSTNSAMGKAIGFIVTTQLDGDMYELARRHILVVNQEMAKRGWRTFPVMVPSSGDEGEKILDTFIKEGGINGVQMDGCILCGRLPVHLRPRYHHFLAERFVGKIIMLCNQDVVNGIGGVTMMDYSGGIQAADVLIKAGHRKIGWIGSLGSENNASERLGGVHTALRSVGCSLQHEIWLNDRGLLPTAEMDRMLMEHLPEDRAEWPTAWVCSTDWLAAKFIVWAKSIGLSIPKDLSVATFDNTQVAEHLAEMVMTSVVFPFEEIARSSVEMLERQFDNPETKPSAWVLPGSIRAGETVAHIKVDEQAGNNFDRPRESAGKAKK